MSKTVTGALLVALSLGVGCRRQEPSEAARQPEAPHVATDDIARLENMIRRFAPVELTADVASLPENERQALAKMVEAAKVFDALFLRQVWEGNETMLLDLVKEISTTPRSSTSRARATRLFGGAAPCCGEASVGPKGALF